MVAQISKPFIESRKVRSTKMDGAAAPNFKTTRRFVTVESIPIKLMESKWNFLGTQLLFFFPPL